MTIATDTVYLKILTEAIRVSADYQPRFGRGRQAGVTLAGFQQLYQADPLYAWLGLDHPLMYAAHRAAGGITSMYRQIGLGCQRVFQRILRDNLNLTADQASWAYTLPQAGPGRARTLTLDARIPLAALAAGPRAQTVRHWLMTAAQRLELASPVAQGLQGAVFEVRQGYKSKDSKWQNADVANAANAYAHQYLPVVVVFSTQIDTDVAERYRRARWLLLVGQLGGTAWDSAFVFAREVVGYDLAAFFERHAPVLRAVVADTLRSLLNER